MNAYGPRPHPANNVDPDAPGGSGSPPACLFANPDCNMPLLVRFHQNRPDRRGRPDESAATVAPRLRTDRFGTVVNPGLEGANVPGQGQAPESARSHDGGAIVNPGRDP